MAPIIRAAEAETAAGVVAGVEPGVTVEPPETAFVWSCERTKGTIDKTATARTNVSLSITAIPW